jgi:hypothetical protein
MARPFHLELIAGPVQPLVSRQLPGRPVPWTCHDTPHVVMIANQGVNVCPKRAERRTPLKK